MNIGDIIKKNVETMIANETNYKLEFISTSVISLNLLFSGRVDGGIPMGKVSMISAPPMLGKSFVGLHLIRNAIKKGMSVVVIDTEKSFDFEVAKALGIDVDKNDITVVSDNSVGVINKTYSVIRDQHTPEERRNVLVVIDSWGNILTSKTIDDAREGSEIGDMGQEAKTKNKLSKVILASGLTTFIINHVYKNPTANMYTDGFEIPGGFGGIFNSGSIVLATSRAKEEDSNKDVTGRIISAKTYKSRYSKDDIKLKYRIKYADGSGLDTFYGILDDAVEGGYIEKPTKGFYTRACLKDEKKYREKEIYNSEFWLPIFKKTDFKEFLEKKYKHDNAFDNLDNIENISKDDNEKKTTKDKK